MAEGADGISILALAGAIFCWGTALVFVKLHWVRQFNIDAQVMTLFYSIGYVLFAAIAFLANTLLGDQVSLSVYGILAGAVWGVGKMLSIKAVGGEIGLALGQAIQCVFNLMTTFVLGVATGEEVTPKKGLGAALVLAGLLILSATRFQTVSKCLGVKKVNGTEAAAPQNDVESTPISPGGAESVTAKTATKVRGVGFGALLAAGAGLCLGLQLLPLKLSDIDPKSFSASMAIGQFLFIAGLVIPRQLRNGKPDWTVVRVGLAAGVMGGTLLYLAAFCNSVAGKRGGVILSGFTNTNMVVSGLWGILLFKELSDARLIVLFFVGACVALGGGVLLVL